MLCDDQIRKANMIKPFAEKTKDGVVSYGVGSYGYDARLSSEFATPKAGNTPFIDPKHSHIEHFTRDSDYMLPPGSFVLGLTVEEFSMPADVTAICVGKSTYARCGIIVSVTPIEAGWTGRITLEIYNSSSYPVKLYVNEGICQFLFFKSFQCQDTYNGNYNDAKGIMGAQVKKRKKVIVLEGDEDTGKTTYAETFYPDNHINFFKDNPKLRRELKNQIYNSANIDYLCRVMDQIKYICEEITNMLEHHDVVCVERLFAGYKYYEGFLRGYDLEPLKCEEELREIADIEYIFFGVNDDYQQFTK